MRRVDKKIKDIYINPKNRRVTGMIDFSLDKQDEIIRGHIHHELNDDQYYYDMAREIALDGGVVESPIALEKEGKMVVHEGNRRVIGLKQLINPGINKTFEEKLIELAKKYPVSGESSIQLVVAPDEETADRWAGRTNPSRTPESGAQKIEHNKLALNANYPKDDTSMLLKYILNDEKLFTFKDFKNNSITWEFFKSFFRKVTLEELKIDFKDGAIAPGQKLKIRKILLYLMGQDLTNDDSRGNKKIAHLKNIKKQFITSSKEKKEPQKTTKANGTTKKELKSNNTFVLDEKLKFINPSKKVFSIYNEMLGMRCDIDSYYAFGSMSRALCDLILSEEYPRTNSLPDKVLKFKNSISSATKKTIVDNFSSNLGISHGFIHDHNLNIQYQDAINAIQTNVDFFHLIVETIFKGATWTKI